MLIQWGIACGRRAEYFVDNLIKYALMLISDENDVIFYLGINSTSDIKGINEIGEKYKKNVKIINTEVSCENASMSHGSTLDFLHEKMTDNDNNILIFSDADTCILLKHWDIFIVNNLKKYDIIGVSYPNCIKNKAKKYPTAFFICFKNKLNNFSFKPIISKTQHMFNIKYIYVDNSNSKIFKGNKIGDKIMLDTGNEVYMKYNNLNMKYFTEKPYNNPISNNLNSIDLYDEILLTHFRKARRVSDKHMKYLRKWYSRINKFINEKY